MEQLLTIYLAAGCFWGVQHHFYNVPGVVSITVGYTGGAVANPSYKEVCTGITGHAEAVKIVYKNKPGITEELIKLYFEIHDFTQANGQGPDLGTQYRSEIFYFTPEQKEIAQKYIGILKERGFEVVTRLSLAKEFYNAEEYHQDYYKKNKQTPYCHIRKKLF